VRKLNADLRAAVLDPATKEKLETTGNFPNPMSPQELLGFIQSEQTMWKPVVEAIARTPQ
jgi:tripartite-type tricarboxylate transporter receptor subunit TctC